LFQGASAIHRVVVVSSCHHRGEDARENAD
jgi:hypothetical protein